MNQLIPLQGQEQVELAADWTAQTILQTLSKGQIVPSPQKICQLHWLRRISSLERCDYCNLGLWPLSALLFTVWYSSLMQPLNSRVEMCRLQLYGLWITDCMDSSTGRQGRRLHGKESDASHLASFNAWAGGGRRSLAWAQGPDHPPSSPPPPPPKKHHHGGD